MKKKLMTLILTLLCSGFVMVTTVGAASVPVENAIGLLNAIDVIEPDELTESNMEEYITRMDFVIFLARLINADNEYGSDNNYYTDIPDDHWGKPSINAMVEKGFLAPGNRMFRPDDAITRQEAAKLVVMATGRTVQADIQGGYPFGYMAVANECELFSGVEAGSELTYRDAAMLLYNTATVDILGMELAGGEMSYSPTDENILSKYYDIYYGEGIVNAVSGVSIDENQVSRDNEVIINGEAYETNEWYYDYLGMNVNYYYIDNDDECSLVYIFADTKRDNEVLSITSENFDCYKDGKLYYYDNTGNTKLKDVRLYSGVTVIRNGENVSDDIEGAFDDFYGVVRVVDTGKYDGADVVIIEDYENILVSYVNKEEKTVYDKLTSSGYCLDREKDVFARIINENGMPATFDEITVNTVLSVAMSSDKKFAMVVICNKTVNGIIEEKGNDSEDKYFIVIDGEKFYVEKSFYEENETSFMVGQPANFNLDLFGRIVYFSAEKNPGMQYGFLINILISDEYKDTYYDEDRALVKMFTAGGQMTVVPCGNRVLIDGILYKTPKAIFNTLLAGDEIESQCIRFSYNSKGEIKEIDTVNTNPSEAKNSLMLMNDPMQAVYKHWLGFFGSNIYVDSKVPMMIVPEKDSIKSAEETKFAVKNATSLASDKSHSLAIYTTDDESFVPEMVVCYQDMSSEILDTSQLYVVEKIGRALNDKEMSAICLTLDSSGEADYFVADDYYNYVLKDTDVKGWDHVDPLGLEPGDVVRIGENSEGEINNIKLIFDYSKAKENSETTFFYDAIHPGIYKLTANSMAGSNYATVTGYGYVSRKSGTLFGWGYYSPTEINQVYGSGIESSKLKVMVVDDTKRQDICTTGSVSDLVSYQESNVDFSKIITMQTDKQLSRMIIFK